MELRATLQAWAADPTAIPPAVLAAINEHVRPRSESCLLLDLPDVLLALVLSKLPARSLGIALRTCRATRRALAAAIQMRAQLLGLRGIFKEELMTTTLDLQFAEVHSLLPPIALPPDFSQEEIEPRPLNDVFGTYLFGPTNEMDLLSEYIFCFQFYLMQANFTEDTSVPSGWRMQRTATGATVKIFSLTPALTLSDDQHSQLLELFQEARHDTSESVRALLVTGQLNDGGWFGPFLCAKLFVHCRRTNELRVLLDCEWDTLTGDRNVVNSAGFTHFKAPVDHFKRTFTSQDEEDDEIEVDFASTFELQIAVLTDLDKAEQHLDIAQERDDAPHTPETDQLIYEKRWFPFEKPQIWTGFLIDTAETHTARLRYLSRLIDGCFDRPHIYRPLCSPARQ